MSNRPYAGPWNNDWCIQARTPGAVVHWRTDTPGYASCGYDYRFIESGSYEPYRVNDECDGPINCLFCLFNRRITR